MVHRPDVDYLFLNCLNILTVVVTSINWFIFYFAIYEKCQVIVLNKLLTQFPEFQSAQVFGEICINESFMSRGCMIKNSSRR